MATLRLCSVPGCDKRHEARGFCKTHYARLRRGGLPHDVRPTLRHSISGTKEYRAWIHIRGRCLNPGDKSYPSYGGRGITISELWVDNFERFFGDLGPAPSPKHSVDRIDNNGNYEPGNCRWATRSQQQRNKRNNLIIEYKGVRLPVYELVTLHSSHGDVGRFRDRVRKGWPVDRALMESIRQLA